MKTPTNPIITRPDRKTFRKIASEANKSQDPVDFYNLGCCFHYGWGTTPNFEKAAACYERAVAAGIATAENNLGMLYMCGHGVEQDLLKAMALFKRAAEKGMTEAMNSLSTIFLIRKYDGIPPCEDIGRSWLLKAAEAGHPSAMNNLGLGYAAGSWGLPKDREKALFWLKEAVKRGHDTAGEALVSVFLS